MGRSRSLHFRTQKKKRYIEEQKKGILVSDCLSKPSMMGCVGVGRLTGTVPTRTFGAGYEAIKRGRERGWNVYQRRACVYRL
jgi:hypothetical protein